MNLDDLEALEAAATAGPWTALDTGSEGSSVRAQGLVPRVARLTDGQLDKCQADAAFIAALRNAAPELIRLARLGEAVQSVLLRAYLERFIDLTQDMPQRLRADALALHAALQEGAKP
jgi:hypothetical protein